MIKTTSIRSLLPDLAMIGYVLALQKFLSGCQTILDVGCGDNSPIRFISAQKKIGIEADPVVIKRMQKQPLHDEYHNIYVQDIKKVFKKDSVDACISLDVIEHLDSKEGVQLLKDMENIATKVVILATPNGYMPLTKESPLHSHHSGWTVKDFEKQGYTVYGMFGPQALRGVGYRQKYKPREFWAVISVIMHYVWTYNHPQMAAAIFAVKFLNNKKHAKT